ncbi:sugar transferase [Pseudaminobacter sp. 19-2017]|uniref:Sugar transferase n=1 Tax=Pseudaminobacter soli (ex Zhang et al. 2022) TaxID=2831468 RepID=A0A942DXP2_9HYPH|nr:sugar transferase [Pseudaminobacter soli]MBS3649426.1 sugar transferase [Pseudaminobacter soli]
MHGDFSRSHTRDLVVQSSPQHREFSALARYSIVKRSIDLMAALLLALPALAIIAFLALLIQANGGRPFYGQRRLGRGGEIFTMWKLRTMVPDAEQRLQQHLQQDPTARLEWERTQKLQSDPRITKLGWYMRKYSIDELPQLWNVLLGQMSLVGPRPMSLEQRILYPGNAYFDMRPGMTGLWQISERNQCSFEERARYDTHYSSIRSLKTDFRILLMTIMVVFRGTGL